MDDESLTNVINKIGISKDDIRIEAIGSVDEASAALGFARASSNLDQNKQNIYKIQQHLHLLMAQLALQGPDLQIENGSFRDKLNWIEDQIIVYSGLVKVPDHFIFPGQGIAEGALALARTVIRRAERRVVALKNNTPDFDPLLINYLNRLSYFIFMMELLELSDKSSCGL